MHLGSLAGEFDLISTPQTLKQHVTLSLRYLYYERADHIFSREILVHSLIAYDFMKYWKGEIDHFPNFPFWQSDISEDMDNLFPNRWEDYSVNFLVATLLIICIYLSQCIARVTFQEGFLPGTHAFSLGKKSPVLKFRGNSPILKRIYSYFLGESTFRNRSINNPDEILEQIRELIIYAEKKLPSVFKSLLAFSKELSPDQKNELIDTSYEHKFALKNCLLSWEKNPMAFAFLHKYLTEIWWPRISKDKDLQSLLKKDSFELSDDVERDSCDDEEDDEDEDEDENFSVGKKVFNEAQERRYSEITKDAPIDTRMATFMPLRKSLQPFMDINLDAFVSVSTIAKGKPLV
jgi:hypothetical protein